ncbi:DASH complex subunit DAD1 [Cytospora mali]|uniref:DASH complex subunit DAD1 n=1 Tax=Cytospora mali TaxID=578113 RepID=A0A194UNN3_CYTMA|nr:DASH complex subunit DAD1 [Valsa mali var. pyri (nom. inval.)]
MASSSRAYFEQQRESLIGEIAMSFEHVLANINKLNRNLEAVIAVGNEFSSVEALWSTFENVMGKEEGEEGDGKDNKETEGQRGDKEEGGGGGHGEDEDVEMTMD